MNRTSKIALEVKVDGAVMRARLHKLPDSIDENDTAAIEAAIKESSASIFVGSMSAKLVRDRPDLFEEWQGTLEKAVLHIAATVFGPGTTEVKHIDLPSVPIRPPGNA